jgi:hypothetical protein
MTLASLLAISALVGSADQGPAPAVTVVDVSKSLTFDGLCDVRLFNTHSRSAVAWVIVRLPDRRSGHTSDFSTAPQGGVAPGTTGVTRISCRDDEPLPSVEAAAVVYDDGSNSGDETVLERHLFPLQRKRARSLRELASVLNAPQLSLKPDVPLSEAFGELIDQAAGPEIDAVARQFARFALQRAAQQHESSGLPSTEQIEPVKHAIVAELDSAAARLEKSSRVR